MADPITRIQILDDTTANQIAAGEVVERPAAAVKELVENALDAGASRVLVELEEGGKYLIRVTDDGCGMGEADAVLALQRHATSKIVSADDLFRITTMGFRGEALPSIASVSQFSMTTRLAGGDDATPGIEIRCAGGALPEVTEVGARSGTSITIENLFYNVPARLKFLKTTSTELSHIVELMQRFALAFPNVAFRLMSDNREVFTASGAGALLDACVHVFGRETARQLAPISHEHGSVTVTGFIGTPPTLRGTRGSQHTFVNRRFIRNKAVTRALDEAYKSVQTVHGPKFAPAVILIAIDPSLVDINVSPTKTEVRFTREGEVYSAVYHGVREALLSGGLVATMGERPTRGLRPPDHQFAASLLDVPAAHPVNVRRDSGSPWSVGPGYGNDGNAVAESDRGMGVPARPLLNPWDSEAHLHLPGSGAMQNTPGSNTNDTDPFQDRDGGIAMAPIYPSPPTPLPSRESGEEGRREDSSRFPDIDLPVATQAPLPASGRGWGRGLDEQVEPGSEASVSVAGGRVAETRGEYGQSAGAPTPRGQDYRGRTMASLRILAQTRNTYILAQTDNALLVIDQHIAHERVLYEKFVNAARTGGIPVQRLVLPLTLELTHREALVVEKRLEELRQAGFELEAFGGESFLVRSVPAAVAQKTIKAQGGPEAVLKQIVEEMVEKTVSRRLLLPAEEVLITASCKMAVKAGDPLTFDEMQALVADLFRSENPYTCPHGRPIIFEMANTEIDKKFGR